MQPTIERIDAEPLHHDIEEGGRPKHLHRQPSPGRSFPDERHGPLGDRRMARDGIHDRTRRPRRQHAVGDPLIDLGETIGVLVQVVTGLDFTNPCDVGGSRVIECPKDHPIGGLDRRPPRPRQLIGPGRAEADDGDHGS